MSHPEIITPRSFGGQTHGSPSLVTAAGPRVRNQDWLALTLTTTDSSGSVEINGRFLTDDGEIVPFTQSMTFSGTGTQTAIVARIGDGWLQGFSVHRVTGTLTDGEVQASVHLGTGGGSLARYECCLASGEITNIRSLGMGAYDALVQTPTPTQMTVASNAPSNPAAGANQIWTVPAGQVWTLQSFYGTFVTSATVASRRVGLLVTDGSNVLGRIYVENAQTASLTRLHSAFIDVEHFQAIANTDVVLRLPQVSLKADYTIETTVQSIQAGDQWSTLALSYVQS